MPRNRPRPTPSRIVRSSGAVVWRPAPNGNPVKTGIPGVPGDIEVAIVHRPRYKDWSWPKGKAEPREHLLTCATREVEEETGLVVRLGAPLAMQRYRLGSGQIKEVNYWVGRLDVDPDAVRVRRPVAKASLREIDQVRWVSPAKARRMLTRRGDRRLLDDVVSRLKAGALDTRTLIVLRHGKATARKEWDGGEATRTLTRGGNAQAMDLLPLLSAYGVANVISSPWERCQATIAPYASMLAEDPALFEALTEAQHSAEPKRTAELVDKIMRGKHGAKAPTVMCTHRPVLETVAHETMEFAEGKLIRQIPRESPWLLTSQMMVLHLVGKGKNTRLFDLELHRPHTLD